MSDRRVRTIRRDDWDMILEKDVLVRNFQYEDLTGKISLMMIRKISRPFLIEDGSEKVKIVDAGYSWVQIAPEDRYFWITSMFDEHDRLLEIYIDMTDGNVVNSEDPYFEDLYLDYVVHGSTIAELDREELAEAYADGKITREQYERTLSEGQKINRFLEDHLNDLKDLLSREQQRLKKLLLS